MCVRKRLALRLRLVPDPPVSGASQASQPAAEGATRPKTRRVAPMAAHNSMTSTSAAPMAWQRKKISVQAKFRPSCNRNRTSPQGARRMRATGSPATRPRPSAHRAESRPGRRPSPAERWPGAPECDTNREPRSAVHEPLTAATAKAKSEPGNQPNPTHSHPLPLQKQRFRARDKDSFSFPAPSGPGSAQLYCLDAERPRQLSCCFAGCFHSDEEPQETRPL